MEYKIKTANVEDRENIVALYKSLVGTQGCTWNLHYPTFENVDADIQSNILYCLCDDSNCIVAVASIVVENDDDEEDYDDVSCGWSNDINKTCELARVGVNKSMHNQGLGNQIMGYIIKDVKERGFQGIHMFVSKTNAAALALYSKWGFHKCGEIDLYDNEWFCYELIL